MSQWKRITPKDGNDGGSLGIRNVYGQDGRQYPRLTICVFPEKLESLEPSFKLAANRKSNANAYWCNHGVPLELAGDAMELVRLWSEMDEQARENLTAEAMQRMRDSP